MLPFTTLRAQIFVLLTINGVMKKILLQANLNMYTDYLKVKAELAELGDCCSQRSVGQITARLNKTSSVAVCLVSKKKKNHISTRK